MTNLTVAIDEETLQRARVRALEQGTSVNALVRVYLEDYAGAKRDRRRAVREILKSSEEAQSGSGSGGRSWTRDELYDRGRLGGGR